MSNLLFKLAHQIFQNLLKTIPDAPKNEVPIFLRPGHTFAVTPFAQGDPWYPPDYTGPKPEGNWANKYLKAIADFRERWAWSPEEGDDRLKQRYEKLEQRRANLWKQSASEPDVSK